MKKSGILFLTLMAAMIASVPVVSAQNKVVIKMAGMKPDGEPETLGMRKFGEILGTLSNG